MHSTVPMHNEPQTKPQKLDHSLLMNQSKRKPTRWAFGFTHCAAIPGLTLQRNEIPFLSQTLLYLVCTSYLSLTWAASIALRSFALCSSGRSPMASKGTFIVPGSPLNQHHQLLKSSDQIKQPQIVQLWGEDWIVLNWNLWRLLQ